MDVNCRKRVATPNDPKLSDGGGLARPLHGGGKVAAEAAGVTARSRSLQRIVRPIGLASDPGIEGESLPIRLSHEGSEAMVAIEDTICLLIQHENDRGRDSSGLRAKLVEVIISLAAANHVGKNIVGSVSVACREAMNDSIRDWFKANRGGGHLFAMPSELRDCLNRLVMQEASPIGSVVGVVSGLERPPDEANERTKPDVEDGIGHGTENPSSNLNLHNL